jgi:thiaminase/transcriptional activator TenA
MAMSFCDDLLKVSQDIWAREKQHPFVLAIGRGDLDDARFRFYLEQDYLYLIDYAKVFALAAVRAQDVATEAYFAKLCAETLNEEMDLHRSYCAEFGLTPADLEATQPSQTTRGYTGHLLQVAATGGITEIVAAVLPCYWGYWELARHLRAQGMPAEPRYRKWIEMYASAPIEANVRWLQAAMERLAAPLDATARERLKRIFHDSSRWEYLFWEMAWQRAQWAVPE